MCTHFQAGADSNDQLEAGMPRGCAFMSKWALIQTTSLKPGCHAAVHSFPTGRYVITTSSTGCHVAVHSFRAGADSNDQLEAGMPRGCAFISKGALLQTTSLKPGCHADAFISERALLHATSLKPGCHAAVHSFPSRRCFKRPAASGMPRGCAFIFQVGADPNDQLEAGMPHGCAFISKWARTQRTSLKPGCQAAVHSFPSGR